MLQMMCLDESTPDGLWQYTPVQMDAQQMMLPHAAWIMAALPKMSAQHSRKLKINL